MPRNISWRKLVKNFKKLDFEGPFAGGKHMFMKKNSLSEILRQAKIDKQDWSKL